MSFLFILMNAKFSQGTLTEILGKQSAYMPIFFANTGGWF